MSSFFSFFYQNVAWQESATEREDNALLCSRKTLQNRVQSCLSRALSQELVMPAGAGRRSLQAGGSEEMVPGTKRRRGGVGVAIYRSRRQTIIRICFSDSPSNLETICWCFGWLFLYVSNTLCDEILVNLSTHRLDLSAPWTRGYSF